MKTLAMQANARLEGPAMHILYLIICLSPKAETNHILQNKLHMSTTMDCLDFNLVCKKQVQVCIITSIFNNSTDYLKHGCDTYWRIKKNLQSFK